MILFKIVHARDQNTILFIEPCPLSRKVYKEHYYISKLLSVMYPLPTVQRHIGDLKKSKKIEVLVTLVAIESL